jgi:signal peptidase II
LITACVAFIIGIVISFFTNIEKKFSITKTLFLITILIAIDQVIKIYVSNNQNISITFIEDWISLQVVHNDYGGLVWSFSKSQMPIMLYALLVPVGCFMVRFSGFYQKECPAFVSLGAILLSSGSLCSFMDRILYNGSYDYLLLYSIIYIDLKDCYVFISFGFIFLSNLYNKTWEESKKETFILYLKYETENIRGILKRLKRHGEK